MVYVNRFSTVLFLLAASTEVVVKRTSLYDAIKIYDLGIWIAISVAGGLIAAGQIYSKLQKLPTKTDFFFIFCRSISVGVVIGVTFQSQPVERHVPLILVSSFGAEYIVNGFSKLLERFAIHPVKFIQDWISYRSFISGQKKNHVIELNLKERDEKNPWLKDDN